ncbi:MAG: hypothetical protein M3336_14365 [Chloroflexota bacterium]|nr:hypothetical protein [Chloroflexota bacterium]
MVWLRRGLLALTGVALLCGVAAALLFYADFETARTPSTRPRARAEWAVAHGDHLHFAGHVLLGRLLDLCPCTRGAASTQYAHARYHAVTPRQRTLLANTNPRTPAEWLDYATAPMAVGVDWLEDGLAWLGGQRPSGEIVVALDRYAMQPSEIHVARGATVIWRNRDQLGQAHTVTAGPGDSLVFDSGWLLPDQQFEFRFAERGEYVYFCRAHGTPEATGMAGAILVE